LLYDNANIIEVNRTEPSLYLVYKGSKVIEMKFQADNFSVAGAAAALPDDQSVDSRSSPGSIQPNAGAAAEANFQPIPGPSGLGRSGQASMPVGASASALANQVSRIVLYRLYSRASCF